MTFGEGGTAAALGVLAIASIVIAARAYTPEYAFHAYLFAAGSVTAIFAIVNRYFRARVGSRATRHRREAGPWHVQS